MTLHEENVIFLVVSVLVNATSDTEQCIALKPDGWPGSTVKVISFEPPFQHIESAVSWFFDVESDKKPTLGTGTP